MAVDFQMFAGHLHFNDKLNKKKIKDFWNFEHSVRVQDPD